MLTFVQKTATRFDICLDNGKPHVYGELTLLGKEWQHNLPTPLLTGEHRKQLAHKCFALNRGSIGRVPNPNRPDNMRDDWQQMPNVEKGHETIKGAVVNPNAVRSELSAITGNPAGWTWDETAGDYVKDGEPEPEQETEESRKAALAERERAADAFIRVRDGYNFAAANFGGWKLCKTLPEAIDAAANMTPDKGQVWKREWFSELVGRVIVVKTWHYHNQD